MQATEMGTEKNGTRNWYIQIKLIRWLNGG